MQSNDVRFSCVGCGICCKGRLIPLTLAEAQQWLTRGHDVAVIVEAFDESNWPCSSEEFAHARGRSVSVRCGGSRINVIAVFAGKALKQCPNLRTDNLCGIYEERPLVCRIYPMEINPFIPLRQDNKVCPPQAWESNDILCTDGRANPALEALINQSRQADKSDASSKVAICAQLGLNVTSWKDNALAVYFPHRTKLLEAIDSAKGDSEDYPDFEWQVRVDDPSLGERLAMANLAMAVNDSTDYIFHTL
ncbi:Fe-S oxidoreductase [Pseudomonas sp. 43NM1]|uniref:YkgJ family cysteine cluster protein n=1 Tax=Pseudomonas gregormendelii TaxID=1628277 RepID=A0ABS3ANA3_9PSED|nr:MULTISPECIES: YkgJ family cysteine cluster protein [Pseudomonas]MBN3968264.1 YkgJ family cysteine cluster protein [Pseudomonas gregormendelii]PKH14605.1 Fe-S oxidoreductase [Pseudomonas sp. 43NM1]